MEALRRVTSQRRSLNFVLTMWKNSAQLGFQYHVMRAADWKGHTWQKISKCHRSATISLGGSIHGGAHANCAKHIPFEVGDMDYKTSQRYIRHLVAEGSHG